MKTLITALLLFSATPCLAETQFVYSIGIFDIPHDQSKVIVKVCFDPDSKDCDKLLVKRGEMGSPAVEAWFDKILHLRGVKD